MGLPEVFGREEELAILRRFLDAPDERPAAVVLAGEPGIGKTALWNFVVEQARAASDLVLTSRPAPSETQLSFAGLRDLFPPHALDVLDSLPPPQRRAVTVSLLLEEPSGAPAGPGAVAAGTLGIVLALAKRAPLLIAIDDVQWLDSPTASVLEFVARRLPKAPVAFALSMRTDGFVATPFGLDRALGPERVISLTLGPLSTGALQQTLRDHLRFSCTRPLLRRLHEASGGNPFFALELTRAIRRSGGRPEAGAPLPVPANLRQLVADRLGALAPEIQEILLAVSALSEPTVEVVGKVLPSIDVDAGLAAAVEEGVVELDGMHVAFTHPLLGSGTYSTASLSRRRNLHRRLADAVVDSQERVRHLSLSAEQPDKTVAAKIEQGARRAWRQAAPYPAGELCERAAELTPPGRVDDAIRRRIDAATYYFEAGDTPAATGILEDVISHAHKPLRLQALCQLARILLFTDQLTRSAQAFHTAAEATDPAVKIEAEEGLAWNLVLLRKDVAAAARHARAAAALADECGRPAALAEALGIAGLAEFLLGRGRESDNLMRRAIELGPATEALPRVLRHPSLARGFVLSASDELDAARSVFGDLHDRAEERGDESALTRVLLCLSYVEFQTGDWRRAETYLLRAEDAAAQTGQFPEQGILLYDGSVLDAHLGRCDSARRRAERGLERSDDRAAVSHMIARRTLGAISIVTGNWSDACRYLGDLVDHFEAAGIVEPGAAPFYADYIESLVAVGRLEEGEATLHRYQSRANATGRLSAQAGALRCRGLLHAALGNQEEAFAELERSLRLYNKVARPFEQARTILCVGMLQRRAKQKRAARRFIGEAQAVFASLGARSWMERAEAELARISGRAPAAGALTPAESRVARLAAGGLTTKEIAAQLFVSPKTVEGHLSNVYVKLAIRSRTELARAFGHNHASADL